MKDWSQHWGLFSLKFNSKSWACAGVIPTNLGPWGKQMVRIDVYLEFIWTLTKNYPSLDLALKEKGCCPALPRHPPGHSNKQG